MNLLITGSAGFIGFHLANRLANEDYNIIGLDNINDYYDINLKYARLEEAGFITDEIRNQGASTGEILPIRSDKFINYRFIKSDLTDKETIEKIFEKEKFDYVVHLAAQAGVRYSLENPQAYINSNITGFFNLLEACRKYPPKHLIFASSSSVYGNNNNVPFAEEDNTDHPVSLYAATKKSNEVMAYAYSSLYNIPTTGLRFFTVYGPWGRPDMAYYSFSKNILEGRPIKIFAEGKLKRDFTYVNDITESLLRLINTIPSDDISSIKYAIYNIGNDKPVEIKEFVKILESRLGKKSVIEYLPMQKGDVLQTHSNIMNLKTAIGYSPLTEIREGLKNFCEWLISYNKSGLQ